MAREFTDAALELALRPPRVAVHRLADDGSIPNNPLCPLLAYRSAVALPEDDPAAVFEALFVRNGWSDGWRDGVFPYHHFHSTAHEVLGVYGGSATVRFGGEGGVTLEIEAGDVVVVPAGVGHKRLAASRGFAVVGAYPRGQHPDLCRSDAPERERLVGNVRRVPVPERDPVYGDDGPMRAHWRASPAA